MGSCHSGHRTFQSLNREQPLCNLFEQKRFLRFCWSFNRSIANSPSATSRIDIERLLLSSFNRSIANSPSATLLSAQSARYTQVFQSLNREQPLCNMPLSRPTLPASACFNRSIANSPSATLQGFVYWMQQGSGFNRSIANSPSATIEKARQAKLGKVSIAQSRTAPLQPRMRSRGLYGKNRVFQSLNREQPLCNS